MAEAKSELRQLLHDKKKSYAKYVKDVHVPAQSHQKAKELENLIERIKHPIRQSQRITPGTSVPLLPPINGLQNAIRRIRPRNAVSQADQESLNNRESGGKNGLGDSIYGQRVQANNTHLGLFKTRTQHEIRS